VTRSATPEHDHRCGGDGRPRDGEVLDLRQEHEQSRDDVADPDDDPGDHVPAAGRPVTMIHLQVPGAELDVDDDRRRRRAGPVQAQPVAHVRAVDPDLAMPTWAITLTGSPAVLVGQAEDDGCPR
jgi:hypothetical protein